MHLAWHINTLPKLYIKIIILYFGCLIYGGFEYNLCSNIQVDNSSYDVWKYKIMFSNGLKDAFESPFYIKLNNVRTEGLYESIDHHSTINVCIELLGVIITPHVWTLCMETLYDLGDISNSHRARKRENTVTTHINLLSSMQTIIP